MVGLCGARHAPRHVEQLKGALPSADAALGTSAMVGSDMTGNGRAGMWQVETITMYAALSWAPVSRVRRFRSLWVARCCWLTLSIFYLWPAFPFVVVVRRPTPIDPASRQA